jgi:hypothetical protein
MIGLPQEAQLTPQLHESGDAPMALRGSLTPQAGLGGIQGTLTDRSGAVIRNARIVATNTETGVQTTRTTNNSGDFTLRPLAAGHYNIEASAPGFQRLLQENVTVAAMQTVGLNLKLSVGAASETITITAAPAALNTMDASLGGVIENELYSQVPLSMGGNPRDPRAFAYLTPGVQEGKARAGTYGGSGLPSTTTSRTTSPNPSPSARTSPRWCLSCRPRSMRKGSLWFPSRQVLPASLSRCASFGLRTLLT